MTTLAHSILIVWGVALTGTAVAVLAYNLIANTWAALIALGALAVLGSLIWAICYSLEE
jgi:hypothetical protein